MNVEGNNITIDIGASAGASVKEINKAISALQKLKQEAKSNVNNPLKGFADSVNKATNKIIEQRSLWKGLGNAGKSAADKISSAFKNMAGSVKNSIKSAFGGVGNAIGGRTLGALSGAAFTVLQPLALVAKGAVNLGAKLGGTLLKGASAAGRGILSFGKTLITLPFKKAISGVSEFGKKIGTLASSFKRILFYRAIRTIIKQIGDAFREGTQNLYYYSQGIGGQFAASMDMAATSMLYFKNSIGAAVAPIVNALAPVLDMIVDKVVAVISAINQLFAKLTGAASWTRAVKYPKQYGDAVSGAGRAAKEALKYLAPFDELNVLPSDRGGGSGAGGLADDYSSMFEEMSEFNQEIADFAKNIREAIEKSDWKGLGELVGGKVNEIVDRIDFAGAGKKIGYYINAWFTTKYWTLETINFTNIGSKIAEFLNNTISEIDFETAGRAFSRGFTLIFDFVLGFITSLDWEQLGKSLGDYLRGAFDEAGEWLKSKDWSSIGNDLWQSFKDLIDGIDFSSLADSFFYLLGEGLGAAVKVIGGFVKGIWDDINEYFQKYLINDDGTKKSGWDWVKGVLEGIWDAIKGVETWIYDHVLKPIVDGFKDAFGIHSPSTVMKEQGGFVGAGILEGIKEKFLSIGTWIKNNITDPFVNKVKEHFGIKGNSCEKTFGIGGLIIQGLWNGVKSTWDEFTGWFSQKWNELKNWWSNLSLGSFKIKTPHISWSTQPTYGWKAKILGALGLPAEVPKMNVSWYARGGIVDRASLIGAGEAGKEAIVPLERNTQWVRMVASQLESNLSNRNGSSYSDGLANDLEDANGVVVGAIFSATAEIIRAMQRNGGGSQTSNIDIDSVAKQVTRWQNNMARANGI